jgi:hypothetical protein
MCADVEGQEQQPDGPSALKVSFFSSLFYRVQTGISVLNWSAADSARSCMVGGFSLAGLVATVDVEHTSAKSTLTPSKSPI